MHRRALLSAAVGGLTTTAGCLGFGFGSDCSRGTDFRLRPTSDADTADAGSAPLETLSPPERDAVAAARRGDEPTMWVPEPSSDPFSEMDYVATDSGYVAAETSVVETVERTGHEIRLEAESDTEAPPSRRVAFADLPAVDRTALYALFGYPNDAELEKFEGARSISIGGLLAYRDDAGSKLVPDPAYDYVRIRGLDFRFRVTDTKPVTVERRRVEVETVAESATELANIVYERRGIDLDERTLSAEQRDIVAAAIDDGYDECAPYSDAYAGLQSTLRRDGGESHFDYANYGTEWYAVSLSEYVA